MKANWNRFVMVNFGVLVMALGLYFFLIPSNLAVGGVTGLAMVIQTFIPSVNLGLLMLIFNAILFLIAFMVIGKEFGGYTIYCSLFLSVVIGVFENLVPMATPLVNDVFLNLMYGILIQGLGMGIIFYQNASTGGTDIVAKIINKYTSIELGKSLFLSDAIITLLAGISFGLELGLYAFIGILINGLVIDKVISGLDSRIQAIIISDEFKCITRYIQSDLDRGVTYLSGYGGYTLADKSIISVVLTKREYLQLKKEIRRIDGNAFMIMNTVFEVIGTGFNDF